MSLPSSAAPLALFAVLLAGCATTNKGIVPPVSLAAVGEVRPGSGLPKGYLPVDQLPDSLALLAPPPAAASARFAADRETYLAAVSNTSAARWEQAHRDAVLQFPAITQSFADLLGFAITPESTPHLAMLLQRAMIDAGLSTYKAKTHHMRTRPFVAEASSTCNPPDEPALRKDGSYPSGHAAIGWMWALVLVQIAPEKTDALVARGKDFGQSRVVCRAHWQSDVDAGRMMAAATFARLQSDPVFQAQLALARKEAVASRAP